MAQKHLIMIHKEYKMKEEFEEHYKKTRLSEVGSGIVEMLWSWIETKLKKARLDEKDEIIQLIDDMIEINELELGAGSELNADWRIGRGDSLKKLKERLK
jgi:hypothetical protein